MQTGELLTQRLELVYRWYAGMVNSHTERLEYLYLPQQDSFVRESSPIRDIASVWDVGVLGEFLHRHELQPLVEASLRHYGDYLVERDGYLILDPGRLAEPSSIAHNAVMLLALLHAPPPRQRSAIAGLADGILRQQRSDGSYKVYFHDLPDAGEELYAGEAMLALLEAYQQLHDARHLQSAERALSYYDAHYFQRDQVREATLVFFANWQSQAGRLLVQCTRNAALKNEVVGYIYRMHDRIIDRGFYEEVHRHPARQVSVTVACALEGLNEALALTRGTDEQRAERYRQCICAGLAYLIRLQRTQNGTAREQGGFGLSLDERAQRIDITGHAASAFMKSVANDIECPLLAFRCGAAPVWLPPAEAHAVVALELHACAERRSQPVQQRAQPARVRWRGAVQPEASALQRHQAYRHQVPPLGINLDQVHQSQVVSKRLMPADSLVVV